MDLFELRQFRLALALEACAVELEQHGWCQFTRGFVADCPKCSVGAIDFIVPNDEELVNSIYDACHLTANWGGDGLMAWNDTEGRTAQEAIGMFRGAAESVRDRQLVVGYRGEVRRAAAGIYRIEEL